MKRRDFILKGIGAGVAASGAFMFGGYTRVLGSNLFSPADQYDLVAIMGADPATMFDKGMASLGGMKKFVSPGQKVVVKPNIGWDAVPDRAANTNPALVRRIVEHCFDAGASEVYVFDNTCNDWNKCYANSGIERASKEGGAKVVPGNTENYYHPIEIPAGKRLREAKVHELILESDVFINVPVLKNHGSAKLTIAMKNLMGIVWDRRFWHKNDLHQCIADYATLKQPDLNVVDAYNVMKQNGPRGVSVDDVVRMNTQLISPDMVAVDAAAAKVFGMEPYDIPYITIADEMGVGNMNLEELNINRIKL